LSMKPVDNKWRHEWPNREGVMNFVSSDQSP